MINKPFIKTAVEENITNTASPKVIGEWTMSRYTKVKDDWPKTNETTAQKKWGTELDYPSLFPLNTVTQQFRDPGIVYSTGYDSFSASYSNADTKFGVNPIKIFNLGLSANKLNDNRLYPRTYIANKDNRFHYWISSARTLAKADAFKSRGEFSCDLQDGSRALQFELRFDDEVPVNKLVAKFNTHIGNPQDITFWVRKGGSWSVAATGIDCPNDGIVEIYRPYTGNNNVGTWTTSKEYYTEDSPNSIDIDGIRIGVGSMQRTTPVSEAVESAVNASLELVEFTPRLAIDLTERTTGYNVSEEISSNDLSDKLVGNVSTNQGSINFMNDDGFFDTSTTSNILNGRLDEYIEFTVDLTYDNSIGGSKSDRTVTQLTMLSDVWTSSGEEEVSVSLVDYSKVLQEAKAQEVVAANVPAYAAIWLLCDGVGFNRVNINRSTDEEDDLLLEYFWVSPKQTVWDIIQELAKSYQLAVFFDTNGVLQVMTRKYLYDRNAATTSSVPANYILYGEPAGSKLSSINTVNRTESHTINKVEVVYKALNKYSISGGKNKKKSRNSILWKPEDPFIIGAAEIVQSFDAAATQIKIDPRFDDALFKYSGRFQIEDTGRILEYTAKQYKLDSGNKWIKSENDMQAAIEENNGFRPKFTGWIKLSNPTHKGLDSVVYDIRENWQCVKFLDGAQTGSNDFNPLKFTKLGDGKNAGGALKITTSFTGAARYKIWKKGESYNEYDRVGIKFKMVKGSDPEAGVVIYPQGTNMASGYHISVTNKDSPSGPRINVVRTNTNGGNSQIDFDAANEYEGPKVNKGRWYYLEAVIWGNEKDWKVNVYINGNYCGTWKDNSAGALNRTQKAQFFVKGDGIVLIDKFYVVNTKGKKKDRDSEVYNIGRKDLLYNSKLCPGDKMFSKYLKDAIRGRYKSKMWIYNFNHAGWATAREIAHYKAEFELPSIKQNLYISNKNVNDVLYKKRPMGATITFKNMSEKNQLVNGSRETRISGANHDEACFIFGTSIRLQEEQKITYKDRDLIRRTGENNVEINASWIQTREAAVSLAQFVRDRFGLPTRNYSMEIYGNPLLELGDIVGVYWPGRSLGEYTYLVSSVSHSWDNGLSTTVGLTMRQDIPARVISSPGFTVEDDEMIPPNFAQIEANNHVE
jgi:hypothetical protein